MQTPECLKSEGQVFLDTLPPKRRDALFQMYLDAVSDMTQREIAMLLIDHQSAESLQDDLNELIEDWAENDEIL